MMEGFVRGAEYSFKKGEFDISAVATRPKMVQGLYLLRNGEKLDCKGRKDNDEYA